MKDSEYYELQANGSAWTHSSPQYRQRLFEAIDSLGDLSDMSVIDVGCGDGDSVEYFLQKTPDVFGLEYSEEKVKYASERGLPVFKHDLDSFEFDNVPQDKFFPLAHVVFCSHTLEHTRDAVDCTKNLSAMVIGGGKLVIIVPHEEAFPTANPSHTQWMSNERIQKVKEVLEDRFRKVTEERKHRLEDEVWLIAEGRKV